MTWKRLTHPNIAPLLGITIAPFQLISDWMPGGDLPEYIKKHPGADRFVLVGTPAVVFISRSQVPLQAIRCRSGSLLPPLLQRSSR